MREFLHSWNRQTGCVTLVMALAVTGAWVRSLCCYDHVDFAIGDRQHIIYSLNGAVSCWSWDLTGDRATRRTNGWGSMFIPVGGAFSGTTLTPAQYRPASTSLQYWTIAIPLTIVSAVLLLIQPRRLSSSIAILLRSHCVSEHRRIVTGNRNPLLRLVDPAATLVD